MPRESRRALPPAKDGFLIETTTYNDVTHNNLLHTAKRFALLCALVAGVVLTACNAKEDEDTPAYIPSESVAITGFSLNADARVMANLDSVFFSIDLEHGVVFNADSLPKGTSVRKLIANISYPSTVASAVIEMSGGQHRTGSFNYHTNPSDTIDFTGDVTLTLATDKNTVVKTYRLKVNVHNEDPDTLFWDRIATSTLPSRLDNPRAQKSVNFKGGIACLLEESDGSYTLSTCADIFAPAWSKTALDAAVTPQVRSLTVGADDTLYILDSAGNLLNSADGASWAPMASGWNGIIGLYGDTLLGFREENGAKVQTAWPSDGAEAITLPQGFPTAGYSNAIEFSNRWTPSPTIVIFGGETSSGTDRSAAWAYDGSRWVDLAENALPGLSGVAVVPYYSYLNSAGNSLLKEFNVFLAFGGRLANGKANTTVYVSYDYGINWQPAQNYMQLPSSLSAGYMVDALTAGKAMESNLSDRWKMGAEGRRRLPFEIDGDWLRWECPYIFLFGGTDPSGRLNNQIRAGVLQRLSFAPLF